MMANSGAAALVGPRPAIAEQGIDALVVVAPFKSAGRSRGEGDESQSGEEGRFEQLHDRIWRWSGMDRCERGSGMQNRNQQGVSVIYFFPLTLHSRLVRVVRGASGPDVYNHPS